VLLLNEVTSCESKSVPSIEKYKGFELIFKEENLCYTERKIIFREHIMASGDQLKALIKSYTDKDDARFYSIAMQVAAREAKQGHGKLARELRDLIDEAKARKQVFSPNKTTPIMQPRGELSSLLTVSYPKTKLSDMVLDKENSEQLTRIMQEQRKLTKLRSHGLAPRRKLLLIGPPGTGKTMSASALSGELSLPLFLVRLDGLITKFMGETAAKLRIVFDAIAQTRGVYLFDEFDSIGTQRGAINDVGEIKRILNSFLQFIEQDESNSLIIAATNQPKILDYALFRRFDDVIEYTLPEEELIRKLIKNRLASYFNKSIFDLLKIAKEAKELSFADITRACDNAVKEIIISNRDKIGNEEMLNAIAERKTIKKKCFYFNEELPKNNG